MKIVQVPIKDFVGKIIEGDCIEVMKQMPENSVDAIVTDPPYGLGFMNKEWDNPEEHRKLVERESERSKQRFLDGKSPTIAPFSKSVRPGLPIGGAKEGKWFQDWCNLWAKECLRVLKPGGHLLSFGGARTYHRMACAIEDAGFEVRDMVEWIYGQGFPKSLNIGKAVDKVLGNKRKVVGISEGKGYSSQQEKNKAEGFRPYEKGLPYEHADRTLTKGTSEFEGLGTALKPAHEPICMARKPISEKTIAENCLKWGTGGLSIDECRIGAENISVHNAPKGTFAGGEEGRGSDTESYRNHQGRFPANLITDGSDEVVGLFPYAGGSSTTKVGKIYGQISGRSYLEQKPHGININDSGSASRFFYQAKPSRAERNAGLEGFEEKKLDESRKEGNSGGDNPRNRGVNPQTNFHPTVKSISLMEYLVKLISRKGQIVLEPFAGSGSTLIACEKMCRKWIGIEKEPDYIKIAEARIKNYQAQLKLL